MIPVADPKVQEDIIKLVEAQLGHHQPSGYFLKVVAVRQEDDWFYVVVEPSRQDVQSYDYIALMTEAEIELQEMGHKNILLVPALPN